MSAGSEILIRAKEQKLKFSEVEIHCRYDLDECSSQNPLIHGLKVMLEILKEMEFRKPLYYFTFPGIVFEIIGLFLGVTFSYSFYSEENFSLILLTILLLTIGIFLIFTGIILHAISMMLCYYSSHQNQLTRSCT
jgi:hypothetical protein